MPMSDYETAALSLQQAYFSWQQQEGLRAQTRHEERIAADKESAAANLKRAEAEQALAAAALESAKAQRDAAQILAGDKFSRIVAQAISRMNDRTGTTSVADIPRAVKEVLETYNEVARQSKS